MMVKEYIRIVFITHDYIQDIIVVLKWFFNGGSMGDGMLQFISMS